jgi:hypothetical protein
MPAPRANNPKRKISYVLVNAAGTKIKAPAAMHQKPSIIPFLNPTRFNKKDEGTDISK